MRSTSKGWTAIAAVALTALMLIATPAKAASPITVSGYSLNGSIVMVTVKNTSSSPVVGTVAVQAKVGGLSLFSLAPVALSGNQTATVGVAFAGSVGKVMSVSIGDDSNPF